MKEVPYTQFNIFYRMYFFAMVLNMISVLLFHKLVGPFGTLITNSKKKAFCIQVSSQLQIDLVYKFDI